MLLGASVVARKSTWCQLSTVPSSQVNGSKCSLTWTKQSGRARSAQSQPMLLCWPPGMACSWLETTWVAMASGATSACKKARSKLLIATTGKTFTAVKIHPWLSESGGAMSISFWRPIMITMPSPMAAIIILAFFMGGGRRCSWDPAMPRWSLLKEPKIWCERLNMTIISGGGRPERAVDGRRLPQLIRPWLMSSIQNLNGMNIVPTHMAQREPRSYLEQILTCHMAQSSVLWPTMALRLKLQWKLISWPLITNSFSSWTKLLSM